MKKNKLLKITEHISEFPTLPAVIARVMQVMDDPNSSASDLTNIIRLDRAMMLRLLKMANSAYYGFPRAIATVTESIVLLGFSTVRNLILTTMMYQFDQMWQYDGKKVFFSQKSEWTHAVATAIACRELTQRQHQVDLENISYLAGLMHDIGKLLFFQQMRDAYCRVITKHTEEKKPLFMLEEKMLGAHHGQVGSWIVDHWNLPEAIVSPIAFHHEPEQAKDYQELTWALYFADNLAHLALDETITLTAEIDWSKQMEERLQIKHQDQDDIIKKVKSELQHIESYMELA